MNVIIQRILVDHLEFFKSFATGLAADHIPHQHSLDSVRKSEVINVGIVQENPSSVKGTIRILQHLNKYPPVICDKCYPCVVYGDQLSCERHNDAQLALSNEASEGDRLTALEPGSQEFHKRMLRVQDTMNILFSGKSAIDKGTLYWLKNVFNHRAVQKEVRNDFNDVVDFLDFITKGYTLLLAAKILHIADVSDTPANAPAAISELSKVQKQEYLQQVSEAIVNHIWHDINGIEEVESEAEEPEGQSVEDNGVFCFCQEENDDDMVECCNTMCTNGKWFHFKSVNLTEETIPAEDEDWFCSRDCKKHMECAKRQSKQRKTNEEDYKQAYSKALLWRGLGHMCRRDAIQENDGPAMVTLWKIDMLDFHGRNHNKYLILAHRLSTDLSRWMPASICNDLLWNV